MHTNKFLLLTLLAALLPAYVVAQDIVYVVAPNTPEFTIPLTPEYQGKDIVLLTESASKSSQTVSVTLGGVAGANGRVTTTSIPALASATALNLKSGWTQVLLGYPNGNVDKTNILVGESTTPSSGGNGGCPSWMDQNIINMFLEIYRALPQYGPGFTQAQLCALFGGSGGSTEPPDPLGDLTPASGVILRDSCSSDFKSVVQFRISLAGQPATVFNSNKSLRVSLKLAAKKVSNSGTLKQAEGRDGPSAWIYLAPAIRYGYDQSYGAPGSDTLIVRKYKNGVVTKEKKFKTRPLYGSVVYDISPIQSMLKGGQLTMITQNGADVYSRCLKPASKKRWFFGKYKKLHGIR
ncbi:MAG: hypothetical protein J0M12_06650 [Deltaproteobacteria bacterium]|nr:hypothetical protein [Deltaproteobacteria bacterium]